MNYPVWQLGAMGGGLMIAMMAVFHVYISHFAVGGGLFLVLTEHKGYREQNPAIIAYARRHTKFFLLITMVAGGITGVGIWFTIALLNPAATSVLIHNFVFAWAIEWVFFTIEIIALLVYFYTYGTMNRRHHLLIGWIYFAAAWMSLFIINGIIDFMLTPGNWIATHNFWDGYFNPSFWPALFFRTALCLIIAGLFGFMTSTWLREKELRIRMIRYCAMYLLIPFAVLLVSAWWYKNALPVPLQSLIFHMMPEMTIFITGFLYLSPLLILGGLLLAIRLPGTISRSLATAMLLIGFLYMGCFEFIREGGRRPYILRNYMYSNSLLQSDLQTTQTKGLLKQTKWVSQKTITSENELTVGRELYNILCLPCHSIGGPFNDIRKAASLFTATGLDRLLSGVANTHPYMPPFPGTPRERRAVAHYVASELIGNRQTWQPVEIEPVPSIHIPAFNVKQDKYILLAWSDRGMQSLTDSSGNWMLLPPGNTLHASLILRGELPEVITSGATLTYQTEALFQDPASQVDFWDNAGQLFNASINTNTGLTGSQLSGTMKAGESAYTAELLPLVPYTNKGDYMPYPTVTITATDDDGTVLATTSVVAPIATELQCKKCHGGPWRMGKRAGISDQTAENVLQAHDRLSGTNLAPQASAGHPVLCQQCHNDSNVNQPGTADHLNMSAAIHGFHANFLHARGPSTCTSCHPADDDGATQAFRGIHHSLDLDCTNCHGALADHALSLLNAEKEKGKKRAEILIDRIQPVALANAADITARRPWINEPDCLHCHRDFQAPEDDTTFNQWTSGSDDLFINRTDASGQLYCAGCHNNTHAIYPAINPYNKDRDALQPEQYQENTYPIGSEKNCALCHTIDMEEDMHHPNMLRGFRNK